VGAVISREQATALAIAFLDANVRPGVPDVTFIEHEVGLEPMGWVFPCQSQAYLDGTGSPLAGNLPIVVGPDSLVRYMTLDEVRRPPTA
jgi:hypothetical protein